MSDMVEIDIDFDYCGEVEMILAHDECGEHEDVEFYRNDLLASDNAKLQEFLQDLADHIKSDDGFGLDRGWLLDRLRELGIEVDDA